MQRKYVWIAYTVSSDEKSATVQAVAEKRNQLNETAEFIIEGPVPLDMYPVGKVFNLYK